MSNLINPSLSPDLYKEGNQKGEGVGRKIGQILCKKFTRNTRKVDVGYYSGGGPNHSKNRCVFAFSLFIAAPQPRGADHGVGSNFTPTSTI